MSTYKSIITPTILGGNIEVKISANSTIQAKKLIETLPYFKSFVKQPVLEELERKSFDKIKRTD